MKKIHKVAITGGTHGNELTGVYLINKFKKNPSLVKREHFETFFMHTNIGAMKQCTRYVDKDLNRTFTIAGLNDPSLGSYEDKLAKEINQKIGPKGSQNPNIDFIVDLHSTTSKMGLSLCISTNDKLTWQVAGYLKECMPEVNIFKWEGDTDDIAFVSSIPPSGFTIEVGSIPQGVLRADMFFETEKMIQHVLDFFELYNTDKLKKTYTNIEVYENSKMIDFPRGEDGYINAMVHPTLQENGYFKLTKGSPLFVTLDGEEIFFQNDETLYALFINEAAYYEKGVAMCLAKKKTIQI
ncbi:aspartoacylase [Sulfurospirillum arcachonense]|uniref:aspartoacylase n=1 Tax=Sulfurospirillum arcachonense TaxID=57666 RepID=UPI000468E052|nr:aspartoacylase [Sulfurospirillum arcachonense]